MLIALAVVVAVLLVALAFLGVRYLVRETPLKRVRGSGVGPRGDGPPCVDDPAFRQTVELLAGLRLVPGNRATLLCSGDETYPRLYEDLRAARRSITLQMYYCNPGRVADTVREIVSERARAGVRVLFLFDAFGGSPLGDDYFDALRAAGVEVSLFRPVRWYSLEKAYNRSHIRVVTVDGRIGYTGGFGLDDKWLGDGRSEGSWRDTNVRFEGPAVMQLQATFAAGWTEATGELLAGDLFFPGAVEAPPRGGMLATVQHCAPTIGSTTAERHLAMGIASATRTLYITNSYFVPDDDFVGLLTHAAERGVDVRVLTSGRHNDVKSTWWAGRAQFEKLLVGGVRLYEYTPTMIHAKTFVADARWASVGTMNFDNRSLSFNDESNFAALDDGFGATVHGAFEEDLRFSREITLEAFRRRPAREKALEWVASRFARVL